MAAALGLALAGPRRYRGVLVDDPFLNAGGRRDATPADIRRALRVYRRRLGAALRRWSSRWRRSSSRSASD